MVRFLLQRATYTNIFVARVSKRKKKEERRKKKEERKKRSAAEIYLVNAAASTLSSSFVPMIRFSALVCCERSG